MKEMRKTILDKQLNRRDFLRVSGLSAGGLVAYLVLTGFFTPVLLVVFLAVPTWLLISGIYRQPKPAEPPAFFPAGVWPLWYVAFAFEHNRRFGLFFLLGLLADLAWRRLGLV